MSRLEQFIANFPWYKNDELPFTPVEKPLPACRVALVSTGGVYHVDDAPFAIKTADDVDESYRRIPSTARLCELRFAHEHFNKKYAEQDPNVIFPLERLHMLVAQGFIGEVARTHYSITGFIPKPAGLFRTGREIAGSMRAEGVDVALLVPV